MKNGVSVVIFIIVFVISAYATENETVSITDQQTNQNGTNTGNESGQGTESNITITNESVVNETASIAQNESLNLTQSSINDTQAKNYSSNESFINETGFNQTVVNQTLEEEKNFSFYIIEFKKEPLLKRHDKALSNKKDISGAVISGRAVDNEIKSYEKELKKEHSLALLEIEGLLIEEKNSTINEIVSTFILSFRKFIYQVTGFASHSSQLEPQLEYYNVFNGIVLNITSEEADKIKKSKFVKEVYLDLPVEITLKTSVPLINADDVWRLDRNGNSCSVSGNDCLTGKGIKVAILDTGVDYKHPDLGGCLGVNCKVIGGYDFINLDSDPMDDHYHGTHVAATVAGKGVLSGVAPDANIIAYKVLSKYGSGSWSKIIAGIEIAVDPNKDGDFSDHADIISMSLGGWGGNPDDAPSKAVDNAVDAGVVVVVAAGNSGPGNQTILTPGTARKAITVGASSNSDVLASFSSRGPVVWSGGSITKPDIVAPGVSIYAAIPGGNYMYLSGTSMATPHVSGAAALLLQQTPSLTPAQVKSILRSNSVSLPYKENEVGSGRVDALKSVSLCSTGETRICSSDIGECVAGFETCVDGHWSGVCVGGILPVTEICDGKDNDCDNAVDDALTPLLCELQQGVCRYSTKSCSGTTGWFQCTATNYGIYYDGTKEVRCNDGKDNDCDGKTDLIDMDDCGCRLDKAYWGTGSVRDGDYISIYVEAHSCNGVYIDYEVKNDEGYSLNATRGLVLYGKASSWWHAVYNESFTKNEYYFVSTLVYNTTISINSKNFSNGTLTISKILDSDGDGINDRLDKCPDTPSYLKTYVNIYGCPEPIANNFDIKPYFYNESIFNLSSFEIGDSRSGKIKYNLSKNLSLLRKVGDHYERLDLDSYIKISKNKIELNEKELPMLNEPATITMFNANISDPVVVRDGKVCTECKIISQNETVVVFSVPHFTTYELVGRESIPQTPSAPSGGDSGGGGSSGGGSGGGGDFAPNKFVSGEKFIGEEWSNTILEDSKDVREAGTINKSLYWKERVKVKIDGIGYHIGIREINESGAGIEINDDVRDLVIIEEFILFGEEKKFELNKDNYYDILIGMQKTNEENKVSLIVEPIKEELVKGADKEIVEETKKEGFFSRFWKSIFG